MKKSSNAILALAVLVLGAAVTALLLHGGGQDASSSVEAGGGDGIARPGPADSDLRAPDAGGPGASGEDGRAEVLPEAGDPAGWAAGAFVADALYGRVVDPDGEPVVGASVHVVPAAVPWREVDEFLAEGETDEAGRFRFPGLDLHVVYRLYAGAEGFLPERAEGTCGRDEEIELDRAVTIGGRVLDAGTGEVLPDVVLAVDARFVAEGKVHDEYTTISDEEGRYRLSLVRPEGLQRLRARRPAHQEERVEFQIHPKRSEGYDIRLASGPVLVLELYELESGALLADTEVELDRRHLRRTDAAGRLHLGILPPLPGRGDSVGISVGREGWCHTRTSIAFEEGRIPELMRIPLSPGARIRGTVKTAEEEPVEGARLGFWAGRQRRGPGARRSGSDTSMPPGMSLSDGRLERKTDAAGEFLITGIAPRNVPGTLRATHPGFVPTTLPEVQVGRAGEETVVEIELFRGAIVHGTVRVNDELVSLPVSWRSDAGGDRTLANDLGAYRFEGVAPGEVRLVVLLDSDPFRSRAFGSRDENEDLLLVEDGTAVEHHIVRHTEHAVISGIVRSSAGTPLPDQQVTCWGVSERGYGGSARATTAEDGTFELEVETRPGVLYTVGAWDGSRSASVEDVAPGTTGIELVLSELGQVGLRVRDEATREPVRRFRVFWRGSPEEPFQPLGGGGREVSPGPEGVYVAELPLGTVDLAVGSRGEGYAFTEVPGIVVDGRDPPTVHDVSLPRGVTVELTFRPADGEDESIPRDLRRGRVYLATDAQFEERSGGGDYYRSLVRWGQTVRVDEGGVATVEALAPARFRFRGLPDGLELDPMEIEVPRVDRATFEIRWREGKR